jgi:hypothetical protein
MEGLLAEAGNSLVEKWGKTPAEGRREAPELLAEGYLRVERHERTGRLYLSRPRRRSRARDLRRAVLGQGGQVWRAADRSRRQERAHRIAYEIAYNEIPEGHHVHHLRESKLCCNPQHLMALLPGEHEKGYAGQLRLFEEFAS